MIRAEGLDEAIRAINELGAGRWLNRPFEEYGRAVQAATAPYVSAPAQSRYRRTGTLGRSWYTRPGNLSVEIGNRAPYAGYVQQRDTQAWMHRQHGWHTVEDRAYAKRQEAVFYRAVEREVNRIFRG